MLLQRLLVIPRLDISYNSKIMSNSKMSNSNSRFWNRGSGEQKSSESPAKKILLPWKTKISELTIDHQPASQKSIKSYFSQRESKVTIYLPHLLTSLIKIRNYSFHVASRQIMTIRSRNVESILLLAFILPIFYFSIW